MVILLIDLDPGPHGVNPPPPPPPQIPHIHQPLFTLCCCDFTRQPGFLVDFTEPLMEEGKGEHDREEGPPLFFCGDGAGHRGWE